MLVGPPFSRAHTVLRCLLSTALAAFLLLSHTLGTFDEYVVAFELLKCFLFFDC